MQRQFVKYPSVIIAIIAVVLAFVSFRQVGTWESDFTLWSHVVQVKPTSVRGTINLGATTMQRGDLVTAEALFRRSDTLIGQQPLFEFAWSRDVLEANWAILNIAQGRLLEAHNRLQQAPIGSSRASVCQMFLIVCATIPAS